MEARGNGSVRSNATTDLWGPGMGQEDTALARGTDLGVDAKRPLGKRVIA
ncbi:hypothetical protein GCM10025784_02720 [Citricoccus nitrophenolicus]